MKTFKFSIITPGKTAFQDDIEGLVIPGEDGFYGILPGHIEAVFSVVNGIVRIMRNGVREFMITAEGVLETAPDAATLLTTFVVEADSEGDAELKMAEIFPG